MAAGRGRGARSRRLSNKMCIAEGDRRADEHGIADMQADNRGRVSVAPHEHDAVATNLPARRARKSPRPRILNVGTELSPRSIRGQGGIKTYMRGHGII